MFSNFFVQNKNAETKIVDLNLLLLLLLLSLLLFRWFFCFREKLKFLTNICVKKNSDWIKKLRQVPFFQPEPGANDPLDK